MEQGSSLAIALQACGIDLEPGGRYKRRSIHECIGGQSQGGISTPKSVKSILIFTGAPGEQFGYRDYWLDDETFLYTGEGQTGDMKMVRGNRALSDHQEKGKEVHLFDIEGKGYVRYVGEMECVDHEWRIRPDEEGKDRKAVVFRLRRAE